MNSKDKVSVSAPRTIESAKNCVRQLDPAGVASTDLADCLKQQLLRHHRQSDCFEVALLICDHLELLADASRRPGNQIKPGSGFV